MAFDTHGADGKPWVGFDLDGTLAKYDHWRGIQHIGEPVKPMCDLIKKMHDEGKAVKIVTARVAPKDGDGKEAAVARALIAKWCRENLGFVPPITHEKDSLMETLYDDRVKAVEQNTGKVLNMANAKFNVGDKAYVHWFSGEDELVDVISYDPKGDYYIVRGEDGQLAHPKASLLYPVKNSRASNSTNAIVRKAMNATMARNAELTTLDELLRSKGLSREEFEAMRKEMERKGTRGVHFIRGKDGRLVFKADGLAVKNFTPTSKFEVGDKVRFKDSVRSVPHDETYTVVKAYYPIGRIIIKDESGKTSDEFEGNLEPVFNAVARNASGHISYTTDAYGKIPKVGEVYSYDGKRVKCTGVSRLSPGYGGIDRYLIEADIVNAVARNDKISPELRKHIPPKLLPHVTEAFKDSDGYWIWFDDKVDTKYDPYQPCGTIHEDTIGAVKSALRKCVIV